jgi:hypothetical protein
LGDQGLADEVVVELEWDIDLPGSGGTTGYDHSGQENQKASLRHARF